MAIRLGDVFVALRGDSSQLKSDLAQSKGQVTSWASGLAGTITKAMGGAVLAGVGAVVAGVGAIGVAALSASNDFDVATKKMTAQLDLTEQGAQTFDATLRKIFANNRGDNIEDIADSLTQVEQAFARLGGTTGPAQLQQATEDALALRDTFDADVNESVEAAVELMDKFGLTSEQAFGFLASGYQKGLNASGDFLDSVTEYSTQFANGGADATQFFSLLQSGLQAGALGTDKAADAFKEFRLRIQDGSKLTNDGLTMLGLNAEEITSNLANGTLSAADAFDIVTSALRNTEDPTLRMQAGVALIGTQFEDLGDSAVANLRLTQFAVDDLTSATDALGKQYQTLPKFFEGLQRRAVVAIAPIGDFLLEIANGALPAIEQAFSTVEAAIQRFIANSDFEWSPEFKQIKLGDLFEFVQADGLGLTRIRLADFFDLTWGSTGIQKLTLGDFIEFINEDGATQINIGDYVTFIQADGVTALTLGDFVEFIGTEESTKINIGDYLIFEKRDDQITRLKLGDFVEFIDGRTVVNIADYVTFVYQQEEKALLSIGDLVEIGSDVEEGLSLSLFDKLKVSLGEYKNKLNLADWFYVELDAWGGGLQKLKVGDFIDFEQPAWIQELNNWDPSSTAPPPFVEKLINFEWPTFGAADLLERLLNWSWPAFSIGEGNDLGSLFSLDALPSIGLSDLFSFLDDDGKYDLSTDIAFTPTKLTPVTLSNLFPFLAEGNTYDLTSLFSFNTDGLTTISLRDLFPFMQGDSYNLANLFAVSELPSVTLADLFPFLGTSGTYDLGSAFTLDGLPSFDGLLAFQWPEAPQTIRSLLTWTWPDLGETLRADLNTLLAWVWPDVPDDIAALLAWIWPAFDAALSGLLTSLISWRWPTFSKPIWLDDLLDFKWPSFSKPGWLDTLLNFRWPSLPLPDWLSRTVRDTKGVLDTTGRAAFVETRPIHISIGPNYIQNQADIEVLAKRVGQRLAYGI